MTKVVLPIVILGGALALLGSKAGLVANMPVAPARVAYGGSHSPAVQPYLLDPDALRPLSPRTLKEIRSAPSIRLTVGSTPPAVVISNAAGSMVAAIWHESSYRLTTKTLVRVIDVRTGRVTATSHPAVPLFFGGLSPDGSEVFGYHNSSNRMTNWYALRSSGGQVVSDIRLDGISANSPWVYDPAFHRLYILNISSLGVDGTAPQSPVIVEYNVDTGNEIGRLNLPGVYAGSWTVGRIKEGEPIVAAWQPGFALSPGGHQIAVLDGQHDTLTQIDARSLRVTGTDTLSPPQSTFSDLATWIGLSPTAALAKSIEGIDVWASYSPDGRRLYVTGTKSSVGPDGKSVSLSGLGIEMIDVASGRIVGRSLRGQSVAWLQPSSDGKAVYSLTWSKGPRGTFAYPVTLRRHDPATLQVTARRPFRRRDGFPLIYLLWR